MLTEDKRGLAAVLFSFSGEELIAAATAREKHHRQRNQHWVSEKQDAEKRLKEMFPDERPARTYGSDWGYDRLAQQQAEHARAKTTEHHAKAEYFGRLARLLQRAGPDKTYDITLSDAEALGL